MGTHSYIAKQIGDDQYLTIYCQLDGHPEFNGMILTKCYSTSEQVDALLALGDLYCLGEKLTPDSECPDFGSRQPRMTVAYQRDRGCSGQDAVIKTFEELYDEADWAGIEYIYIYALNGQWFYLSIGNPDAELRCLKDDLENDTIQYNEPPDLDVLLGKDWDDEQEDGPSIEL